MGYPLLGRIVADVRDDALSTREGAGVVTNLLYTMGASLTDGQGNAAVGGSSLLQVGSVYHLMMAGDFATTSVTPPTFTMDTYLGGATMNIGITLGSILGSIAADVPWWYESWLTVRAIGSGTTTIQGFAKAGCHAGTAGALISGEATGQVTGKNSTGPVTLGLVTNWSAATTGNLSQCREAIIELLHA